MSEQHVEAPPEPQVILPPRPEERHIIQAQNEELARVNDNRIYLIALVRRHEEEIAALKAYISDRYLAEAPWASSGHDNGEGHIHDLAAIEVIPPDA